VRDQWVEPAAKLAEELGKALHESYRTLRPYVSELQASLLSLAFKAHLAKGMEDLNGALEKHGWFVPPSLSANEVSRLREMVVMRGEADAAVDLLLELCDSGLSGRIIDAACSHRAFEDRVPLLREGLAAHGEGRYALSIPVLLAQAEGAYLGFLEGKGVSSTGMYKHEEWAASEIEALAALLPLGALVSFTALQGFSKTMYEQFTARVLSAAELAALQARFPRGCLSRHAVIHGRDPAYATRENSAKALFIVDSVRALLDALVA